MPLLADSETVVKEKLYLDKNDPDILRNETPLITITRWPCRGQCRGFYRRDHNPIYEEYPCTEDNRWIAIGGELYLADGEGYLMSIRKDQSAPHPKYLQKYFQPKK